ISTGGTLRVLQEAGIAVKAVDEVTGFPEILDGRVKTLHPLIHGGLLAKRDDETHQKQLQENKIQHIDVVVVNLYPFKETLMKHGISDYEIIENIYIGGPAMLRASVKNFSYVTVVVEPADYDDLLTTLKYGEPSIEFNKQLAAKVYRHT